MGEIYEFKKSLNAGQMGEYLVEQYLKELNNVQKVVSVQNNIKYQKEDIDFLVYLKNGKKVSVEVKCDSYKSGNLYYETKSCVELNTPGCFEKTKADYIFYYFIKLNTLYILKTQEFKTWVNKEIEMYNKSINYNVICKKTVFNKISGTKGEYFRQKLNELNLNQDITTSEGFTIPLEYMEARLGKTNTYKKINNFSDDFKIARSKIECYLKNLDNVNKIEFIDKSSQYKNEDSNFKIYLNNGTQFFAKFICDNRKNKVLNYRIINAQEADRLNYCNKIYPNFLFYYFSSLDVLYIFKNKNFESWVFNKINNQLENPILSNTIVKNNIFTNKNIHKHESFDIPLNYIESELRDTKIYKKYYNI